MAASARGAKQYRAGKYSKMKIIMLSSSKYLPGTKGFRLIKPSKLLPGVNTTVVTLPLDERGGVIATLRNDSRRAAPLR
jgi:hypothetical protein